MKRFILVLYIMLGITLLVLAGCEKDESEHSSSYLPASSKVLTDKVQMPEFELISAQGEFIQSKSLQGKTLLVIFFSPTCPACYSFLAEMEKLQTTFMDKDFSIVAIVHGRIAAKKVAALYKKIKISYPLLIDQNKSLHKKFGTGVIFPILYLVNNKGIIEKQYLGHPEKQSLAVDIEEII
ncbi:MAG: TlpA family protein disulfide reductase [Desulfobulbaceae bacterium]|nr:TlpA family protein disulfide reductase [Desulfobulbaceae bacterium]